MSVPTLDVFRGSLKDGAIWIESADGLPAAVELMNGCAKSRPGRYFVFDIRNQKVLATTDSNQPKTPRSFAKKARGT